MYMHSPLTMKDIADEELISIQTVMAILDEELSKEERKKMKRLKYSNSKLGESNPMLGKKPGNYIGECSDHHGYLTEVLDGKRYFKHRIVVAKALGIHVSDLPSELVVHHINEITTDNRIDNLCLLTNAGHKTVHRLTRRDKQ